MCKCCTNILTTCLWLHKLLIRPTRRNILFPVSRPTHFFFKKRQKNHKKRGFQMASCSYALFFCNASLDCMSSVGVCVSVTRGASTILRERLLRIPDTCSLLSKIATDASGWVWLRKDGRGLVIVRRGRYRYQKQPIFHIKFSKMPRKAFMRISDIDFLLNGTKSGLLIFSHKQ